MHVVERGIDEAVIVDDVIVRVLAIAKNGDVRVAISSPHGTPRYQEVILKSGGTQAHDAHSRHVQSSPAMLEC